MTSTPSSTSACGELELLGEVHARSPATARRREASYRRSSPHANRSWFSSSSGIRVHPITKNPQGPGTSGVHILSRVQAGSPTVRSRRAADAVVEPGETCRSFRVARDSVVPNQCCPTPESSRTPYRHLTATPSPGLVPFTKGHTPSKKVTPVFCSGQAAGRNRGNESTVPHLGSRRGLEPRFSEGPLSTAGLSAAPRSWPPPG
jgi:hypothetical protein